MINHDSTLQRNFNDEDFRFLLYAALRMASGHNQQRQGLRNSKTPHIALGGARRAVAARVGAVDIVPAVARLHLRSMLRGDHLLRSASKTIDRLLM